MKLWKGELEGEKDENVEDVYTTLINQEINY